jgi:DUF4097 and DUF4098 domain-containing protein YvlB
VLWGALHVAGWTLGTATHTDHRVISGHRLSAVGIVTDGNDDVVVEAGAGPDVTIDSSARGAFRAPRLRVSVNATNIHVSGGCGADWFDRCHASVTVRVPPGVAIDVRARSGDVRASGLSGYVRLATASGDVAASELSGTANLHTSSGDVDVHDLSGTAYLRTSSGDVAADGLSAGTVRAHTGSGDVDLLFSAAPAHADAETGSGDVSLLVPRGARYAVDAETSSGDRVVGVAPATQARHVLRARTGSGDVNVLYGS